MPCTPQKEHLVIFDADIYFNTKRHSVDPYQIERLRLVKFVPPLTEILARPLLEDTVFL